MTKRLSETVVCESLNSIKVKEKKNKINYLLCFTIPKNFLAIFMSAAFVQLPVLKS